MRFITGDVVDFLDLSKGYMYMINGSWRNFILRDENSTGTDFITKPINQTLPTFYATQGTLKTYLNAFLAKLREISDKTDEEKVTPPKNNLEDNDLKLDIYLKFKNLYDKWISTNLLEENDVICLSKYFKYRDRAMNPIGDLAIINPESVIKLYDKSDNSLYNILYEMLSQNNFDFFPLPHFNDFGASGDEGLTKLKNMFVPKLTVGELTYKPSFVCMFIGSRASTVDFGNSEFGNDVVDFSSEATTPSDLANSENVAVFEVEFGLENQNVFKSISLDQSDYKETSESLQVIDDLSKSGGEANAVSFKGNNLYQVYNKRSYNCEVQMMGCAVIEPMTYFQLNNVPMFKGAYMIHKISHNITPNHMTTNFTGVRIPYTNVPVVTDYAVAVGLLDSIVDSSSSSSSSSSSRSGGPVLAPATKEGIVKKTAQQCPGASGNNKVEIAKDSNGNPYYAPGSEEAKNIQIFIEETAKAPFNITDPNSLIGMLSVVGKESTYVPKNEYMCYSAKRLSQVWPIFSTYGYTEWKKLKESGRIKTVPDHFNDVALKWAPKTTNPGCKANNEGAKDFANFAYNPKDSSITGQKRFSDNSAVTGSRWGEGWKYRGRGFNQVTWKANYEAIQKYMPTGTPNLVTNPDEINKPKTGAQSNMAYYLDRFNSGGNKIPATFNKANQYTDLSYKFKTAGEAMLYFAWATNGWGSSPIYAVNASQRYLHKFCIA